MKNDTPEIIMREEESGRYEKLSRDHKNYIL